MLNQYSELTKGVGMAVYEAMRIFYFGDIFPQPASNSPLSLGRHNNINALLAQR